MKTFIHIAVCVASMFILPGSALGEDGEFVSVHGLDGMGYASILAMAIDESGNIYLTGSFQGTVDFDFGPSTYFLSSLESSAAWPAPDVFIMKIDSEHQFIWVRRVGGLGWDTGYNIAIDEAGIVYVAGDADGGTDFDPGPGIGLVSGGKFILSLDSDGEYLWAQVLPGAYIEGIVVNDQLGQVCLSGRFSGTQDFDRGNGIYELTASGGLDGFVLVLSDSGDFVRTWQLGGFGRDASRSIAIDSNSAVYTTGSFQGTADFDPSLSTYNLEAFPGEDDSDAFITKIDSSGNLLWAKAISGQNNEIGESIVVDSDNNVFVGGIFWDTALVETVSGPEEFVSFGDYDFFIAKMNTDGDILWARQYGEQYWEWEPSLAVDNLGGVFTGLQCVVNIVVGISCGTSLYRWDNDGDLRWRREYEATAREGIYSIGVDSAGSLYAAGFFNGEIDMDPNSESTGSVLSDPTSAFFLELAVDLDAPDATAIVPSDTSITNIRSVTFAVDFDEEVVNFDDVDDLNIDHAGTSHTGIVIDGGPSEYKVTVYGISGVGTFNLSMNIDSDVRDLGGNALGSTVTSVPILVDNTGLPIVAWPVAILLCTGSAFFLRRRS